MAAKIDEEECSDWTIDTLRLYLERIIESNRALSESRFASIDSASSLAFDGIHLRLDGMNEFRTALNDIVGSKLSRSDAEVRFVAISDKIDSMVKVIDHKFDDMGARLNRLEFDIAADIRNRTGRESGLKMAWAILAAVAGLLLTVLLIIIAFITITGHFSGH